MGSSKRIWKLEQMGAPHNLAGRIAERQFTLRTGFVLDQYVLLNVGKHLFEAQFAVCRQVYHYGDMDFQPIQLLCSVDFTTWSQQEVLEYLNDLAANGVDESEGAMAEIPYARLLG